MFNILKRIGHVFINTIDQDPDDYDAQTLMNYHYRLFIRKAFEADAYLKIVPPDVVISAGSIPNVMRHLRRGKMGIAIPVAAIRVDRERFLRLPMPYAPDGTLSIPPHDLVNSFLKTRHRETRDHFIDSENFYPYPAMILTPYPDGFSVNSFVAQAWFVRAKHDATGYIHGEYDYIYRALPDLNDIHIVGDSNEIFEVSITPHYFSWGENKFSDQMIKNGKGAILGTLGGISNPYIEALFKHGYQAYSNIQKTSRRETGISWPG